MKIQLIGTGSMWNKYNSASYLIDDEILIDVPNGTCKNLYKINIIPKNINYVLITHFHGDHYFDMPFYILNKLKSENKNINIYCIKEGKSKIKKIFKLAYPNDYKKRKQLNMKFNFNNNFYINKYKIFKLLMNHGHMIAYGYVFNYNDKYIGFTGDTSLCSSVFKMCEMCSYLFCDCALLKGNNKHMGIIELNDLAKRYPNCKFIPIHLNDETRIKLENNKINNIIVSKDYDIFKID